MSLVIPVFKNAANIPSLLEAVENLNSNLGGQLEVVFVIDGSPDDSALLLMRALPKAGFRSQLLNLSRNFGAFSAIRAGLEAGTGEVFAVMAADLQEPPELVEEFQARLSSGDYDVAVGVREAREDPFTSRLFSSLFWWCYRKFIQPAMPPGGVDVFACTRQVRDQIINLSESHSSLVGLLFWLGFRRCSVPYVRRAREQGASAWTFRRKLAYMADSFFSFSDLPIRILVLLGTAGLVLSIGLSVVVFAAKLTGGITVPGYSATVLVVTFFGALNSLGLGVVGGYVWRSYENTKVRPSFVLASHHFFEGIQGDRDDSGSRDRC